MNDIKYLLLLTPGTFLSEIPGVFRLFISVSGGELEEGGEELEEGGRQTGVGRDGRRTDSDVYCACAYSLCAVVLHMC